MAVRFLEKFFNPRSSVAKPCPPPITTIRGPRSFLRKDETASMMGFPGWMNGRSKARFNPHIPYAVSPKPSKPKMTALVMRANDCSDTVEIMGSSQLLGAVR